jgi:ABC-2 type transport system permease protein
VSTTTSRPRASSLRILATLAGKDLTLLSRDRFALFWVLVFPLFYGLFFGSVFAGEPTAGAGTAPVPITVVDRDGSPASRRLLERLAQHPALRLVGATGESQELAEARVKKGECIACVQVPAGYGASPLWLFGAAVAGGGDGAFELGIDPTRRAEAGLLHGILVQTAFACAVEQLGDRDTVRGELRRLQEALRGAKELGGGERIAMQALVGAVDRLLADVDDAALARLPQLVDVNGRLRLRDLTRPSGGPRSSYEVMFPSAAIWGLMSVVLSFAVMLVRERTQGTLLRLCTAPFGPITLLAGKALACFVACMASMGVLLAFGNLLLSVRISSPWLGLLAMACTAFCFTGLMLVAAVLGRSEQAVTGAAWGVLLPMAMIGGGMIPLVAMPAWLAALSDVSPVKWGILALEGAVWRGFTLGDCALPCGILLAVGGVGFVVATLVFRRGQR